MHRSTFLLIALIVSNTGFSQQSKATIEPNACGKIISNIELNEKSVSRKHLKSLFIAFSDSNCINNVEFQETANELLFTLVKREPKLFCGTLFRLTNAQIESVKVQIDHPVNDGINVIAIYKRVNNLKVQTEIKARMLKFLDYAYHTQLKNIQTWEEENGIKWVFPKK